MEKIGKHISELLFDHDCVIIPSLGGFLASNQPAHILLPNHILSPPYRRIAFNVYLKQNDGLLANHLVESENINYSEATKIIDSFTIECLDTLDNGRKINIDEVGTLYYDKEKNIQFEADRNFNHLLESFGMGPVHFLPIKRSETVEIKKVPQKKTIRESVPQAKEIYNKKTSSGKSKKVLGIAVVASALILVGLNLYVIAPKKYESTSLNPFDSQNIVISKTDSIRNIPSETTNNNLSSANDTQNGSILPESTVSVEENNSGENSIEIEKNDLVEAKKDKLKTSTQIIPVEEKTGSVASSKHYLIAGVFKIKENAQSMLLHLQQLGFANAQLIEANECNYVSYEGFDNHIDALTLADSLQRRNLEGWIWKH